MDGKKDCWDQIVSASTLLEKLFTETLADTNKFDPDVVALIKRHLDHASPHSKAGNKLAGELVDLAKKRVERGGK